MFRGYWPTQAELAALRQIALRAQAKAQTPPPANSNTTTSQKDSAA